MDKLKVWVVAVPIKNEASTFRIKIRNTKIWTEFYWVNQFMLVYEGAGQSSSETEVSVDKFHFPCKRPTRPNWTEYKTLIGI